jgi:uncharacterized protein YcfJ
MPWRRLHLKFTLTQLPGLPVGSRRGSQDADMNTMLKCVLATAALAFATQAAAEITFYEDKGFDGRSFTAQRQIKNLNKSGFNDRASSVIVRGDRWEVCEHAKFGGRCAILRRGSYPSLSTMGLNNRISSLRIVSKNAHVDDDRYGPAPVAAYDYRRRSDERLYEANVTSARAVMGQAEQRCWIEREQVENNRTSANVGGAVVGAVIGGILGHQIGSGRGQDVATVGGAVVGGVVGANVNRDRDGPDSYTRDVRRCESAPSQSNPDYWDVTYDFRGQGHRVQMTSNPGSTIAVNRDGEPRV